MERIRTIKPDRALTECSLSVHGALAECSVSAHRVFTFEKSGSAMRHCARVPFGYTSTVTSKKGVIGCGSPKARGAEPHPARFSAFLFQATSYGGPNGRAQALPVTLRVPRSSTPVRAAAQCGSWSAVVHQAQLEINMTQSIATGTSAANPHTAQELLDTIQLMDSLSQEGFSKIGSIARLVLRSLDKPSPRQTEDLSNALRAIWHQSDDSMNCINCQAEVFGANFKGESHA